MDPLEVSYCEHWIGYSVMSNHGTLGGNVDTCKLFLGQVCKSPFIRFIVSFLFQDASHTLGRLWVLCVYFDGLTCSTPCWESDTGGQLYSGFNLVFAPFNYSPPWWTTGLGGLNHQWMLFLIILCDACRRKLDWVVFEFRHSLLVLITRMDLEEMICSWLDDLT